MTQGQEIWREQCGAVSGIVEEETEHTREIEQAPASSDVLCAPPAK